MFRVRGYKFSELKMAVQTAKEKAAKEGESAVALPIFDDERQVFVAIVVRDANGTTVQKLSSFPTGVEL